MKITFSNNKNVTSTFIPPDVYFEKSKEEINEINIDDDNNSNYGSNSEKKISEKSDDNSNSDEFIDLNHSIHDILLYEEIAQLERINLKETISNLLGISSFTSDIYFYFEEKEEPEVDSYNDRSYYYNDRRYERKESLMISPIISLVII